MFAHVCALASLLAVYGSSVPLPVVEEDEEAPLVGLNVTGPSCLRDKFLCTRRNTEIFETRDRVGNVILRIQVTWLMFCSPCASAPYPCMKCLNGSPRRTIGCWDVTKCDDPETQECGESMMTPDGLTCQLPNVRGCDPGSGTGDCQCYTLQPIKWRMNSPGDPSSWVHACGEPVREIDKELCSQDVGPAAGRDFLGIGAPQEQCNLYETDGQVAVAPVKHVDDECDVPGCCIPGTFQPGKGTPMGCRGC